MLSRSIRLLTLFVFVAMCGATSRAQTSSSTWPNRAVTIVVAFGPGASNDITARTIAQVMSVRHNQPFVVENRAGAGGLIAARHVSKLAPDGYTLLLTAHSVSSLGLGTKTEFNATKELTPITQAALNPQVMMVPASLGLNSVKDFIAFIKANPDRAFYGITDPGGSSHQHFEEFNLLAGIKMKPVVYQSAAPMMTDLSQGRLVLMFGSVNTGLTLINGGLLKVIAYTGEGATADSPKAPNIKEAGIDFEWFSWNGVFGPPGMAPELLKTINAALNEAMRSPEYRAMLAKAGATQARTTPEEFAAIVRKETENTLRLMKITGVKPED